MVRLRSFLEKFKTAYRSVTNNGVSNNNTHHENICVQNSNLTLILALAVVFIYLGIDLAAGNFQLFFIQCIQQMLFLSCLYFISKRQYLLANYIALFTANIATYLILKAVGPDSQNQLFFLVAIFQPFLVFSKKDKSHLLFFIGVSSFFWIVSFIPGQNSLLNPINHPEYYSKWIPILAVPNFFISVLIQSFFTFAYFIEKSEKQSQDLINSNRLAAVGEMAGGIAHEINNPLAIISGALSLAKIQLNKPKIDIEVTQAKIDLAQRTVQRISNVTSGLLAFARRRGESNTELQQTSPDEIVKLSLSLSSEKYKSYGIQLLVDLENNSTKLKWNETQASQVLINLLGNAFDAVCKDENARVKICGRLLETKYEFRVLDSGRGIPPDIEAKMMEPFFTTKSLGKGTGLGLSISKGLVESIGGEFYYDRKSASTCFVLSIPLATNNNESQVTQNIKAA